MSLQEVNKNYERKSSRPVYIAAAVIAVVAILALALALQKVKTTPEETTTTSLAYTTTTTTTTKATTTIEETSTAVITSSAASTTTSTEIAIACSHNSDCGLEIEKRVCYLGDVYLKKVSQLCKNPGRADAYCVQKESWSTGSVVGAPIPEQKCMGACVNGTCVKITASQ
ncbi:MAG: hypothetical protein PHG85_05260 [Candidatus Altiarchaeota archaeon]|nr:hypothetical protein [Candidatus Altiarchaeota archaeon]